ncbi:MAG: radical SAM protein [Clostridiales bacterium]|nr:radical SAM protein [Clostridiales bacterium]
MYKYNETENVFYKVNLNEKFQLPQIVWHITDKCHLSCFYCFADKTGTEFDVCDLDMYISKFRYLNIQKIDISGGEPLLFDNLDLLCGRLKSEGFQLTLTTTGIGTEKSIKWLIQNRNIFSRIILSMDIMDADIQDMICGGKNILKRTKDLHQRLIKNGYKKVRINTVATRYLLNKCEIVKMAAYMRKTEAAEWCMIEMYPAAGNVHLKETCISREQFQSILDIAESFMENSEICSVISRYSDNYNGYWILVPDGSLFMRSVNFTENMKISLRECKEDEIKNYIVQGGINFPGKE